MELADLIAAAQRAKASGNLDEAIDCYAKLEAADPEEILWTRSRAEVLKSQGNEEAYLEAQNRLARLHADRGESIQAIAALKSALELSPRHGPTRLMMKRLQRASSRRPVRPGGKRRPLRGARKKTPSSLTAVIRAAAGPRDQPERSLDVPTMFGVVTTDSAFADGFDPPTLMGVVTEPAPDPPPIEFPEKTEPAPAGALAVNQEGEVTGRRSKKPAPEHRTSPGSSPAPDPREHEETIEGDLRMAPDSPAASKETVEGDLRAATLEDLPAEEIASLPAVPLLSSLSPEAFDAIVERARSVELAEGDVLFEQGAEGRSLFIVTSGRIEVLLDGEQIGTNGPGDFFGEVALFTDRPRGATVRGLERAQLLEIERGSITDLSVEEPEVLSVLLGFVKERLVDMLTHNHPLFGVLSEDDKRALVQRFGIVDLEDDYLIIEEGEPGSGLFVLMDGEVVVRQGRTELARLRPGHVFGEISLISNSPATATVIAAGPCLALKLPASEFEAAVEAHPELGRFAAETAEARMSPHSEDIKRAFEENRLWLI